ncbi:MAG: molecular chaperone DjlA [Sulfurimonas sp. RIFOXYD12_FULL_33_39]|uniref:TerB family tellurite resistance protein n=1 Tax=unclassified Sulfurimonas TaxID=2623549 RepID=UPI0008BC0D29|nr:MULTISPECIES: TerB family tellurite resistance protein [unclassified Sulfurimonas]OHE10482.1 MAG: molecular chaperone DjlA [Sulfurimonas sp. RIFOXYD12_FULL_33_39]OHE14941.1 MAG: molecular chaperone DjlA [Sulfurimonas sp. RIFOXYD2_FULL_34_21]DAB28231.1 MAG TPA: molecular chaperone DjlA [Sulfurimonas sp. UBA10385]
MGNIILLAVLGGFFYWIFKSYSKYTAYSQEAFKNFTITKESLQKSDLGLFIALVAKVAKADGKVDALEAELIGIMFDDISAVFPQPQKTKDILKEIFNEEKDRTDNLQEVAHALGSSIKRDRAKQHQFMGFLIQLAFVDGEVSKAEEEILASIAEAFEFDPNAYHAIFDQFEKMIHNIRPKANVSDAYKLLGVNESDDMDVVKKAYRKLIREYHPDIIKSQGKDDAYMQEATAKTQEINQAYEMIKAHRK